MSQANPAVPSIFGGEPKYEPGPVLYCPVCSSRPGAPVRCANCGRQTVIPPDKAAVAYTCAQCGGTLMRSVQTVVSTRRDEAAGFEPFATIERRYLCATRLPRETGGGQCGTELEFRRFKVPLGAPTPPPTV